MSIFFVVYLISSSILFLSTVALLSFGFPYVFSIVTVTFLLMLQCIYFGRKIFSRKKKGEIEIATTSNLVKKFKQEWQSSLKQYRMAVKNSSFSSKINSLNLPIILNLPTQKSELLLTDQISKIPFSYVGDKDKQHFSGLERHFFDSSLWLDFTGDINENVLSKLLVSMSEESSIGRIKGVNISVSIVELLEDDSEMIYSKASEVRQKVDIITNYLGYEQSIFLTIRDLDKLEGASTIFSTFKDSRYFGASITTEFAQGDPAVIFALEFEKVLFSLRSQFVGSSINAKDDERKSSCNFLSLFDSLEAPIIKFIKTIFERKEFGPNPLFSGFYFLHSSEKISDKLFSKVIPSQIFPDKLTAEGEKRISFLSGTTVLVLITLTLIVGGLFFRALIKSSNYANRINAVLYMPLPHSASKYEYELLDSATSILNDLHNIKNSKIELLKTAGFFPMGKYMSKLKKNWYKRNSVLVLKPALAALELEIKRLATRSHTAQEYNLLYKDLKCYLTLSEEVAGDTDKIDTMLIKTTLLEKLKPLLVILSGKKRIEPLVEISSRSSLSLFVKYLIMGELDSFQADQNLVTAARRKLNKEPGLRLVYESMKDRMLSEGKALDFEKIFSADSYNSFDFGRTINSLYTPDGFKNIFKPELKRSVGSNLNYSDWVSGNNSNKGLKEISASDREKQLTKFFMKDVENEWLKTVRAIEAKPINTIENAAKFISLVSSEKSPIRNVLTVVSDLSGVEKGSQLISNVGAKVKSSGVGFKKKKDILGGISKYVGISSVAFISEEKLNDYLFSLADISKKLLTIDESDIPEVFNGSNNDPMLASWDRSEIITSSLPSDTADVVVHLLQTLLLSVGDPISKVYTQEINRKWKESVYSIYDRQFVGRYPFENSYDDAQYKDVADFFRPKTGILSGFLNKNMRGYITEKNGNFSIKGKGAIFINAKKGFAEFLNDVAELEKLIYRYDGREREFKLSFIKKGESKLDGKLVVDGVGHIITNSSNVENSINWPISRSADIELYLDNKLITTLEGSGEWGIYRLLDNSERSQLNASTIFCKWNVTVQNIYQISYGIKLTISEKKHPFRDNPYFGVECPDKILSN